MTTQMNKVEVKGTDASRKMLGLGLLVLLASLAMIIALGVIEKGTGDATVNPAAEPFDYEEAAELSAMRWIAMAKFYDDNGQLTNVAIHPVEPVAEPFDYEEAAELSAMRWIAMAKFYEANGLLTGDDLPSVNPAVGQRVPQPPITPWEYNHGQ